MTDPAESKDPNKWSDKEDLKMLLIIESFRIYGVPPYVMNQVFEWMLDIFTTRLQANIKGRISEVTKEKNIPVVPTSEPAENKEVVDPEYVAPSVDDLTPPSE